jgi:D-inositol-3-phosphate glycosyltransferase
MKRLLFVGDAAVGSGFGKATGHILRHMAEDFRTYVIGVNYRGDPHEEGYHIWPAVLGGDVLGVGMLKRQFARVRPDVIVLQANPWNIPYYMKVLRDGNYTGSVVGIIAVEGANCVGTDLKGLDKAIFWTEFGKREARGWTGRARSCRSGWTSTSINRVIASRHARR